LKISEITSHYGVKPVTETNWNDFEELFGAKGACGGCWCMWWRLKRSEFDRQKGERNRESMKAIVKSGEVPGIIIYLEGKPAGWCSLGPRENFSVLERSRILKKVDEQPVWSIVCFFIPKQYRRRGISLQLIKAAMEYAVEQGAKVIEAYPHEPAKGGMPDVFANAGILSAFMKAGFKEVARRSGKRPIVRYYVAHP
jgi:GNAT superfamily N-acetyltransferase